MKTINVYLDAVIIDDNYNADEGELYLDIVKRTKEKTERDITDLPWKFKDKEFRNFTMLILEVLEAQAKQILENAKALNEIKVNIEKRTITFKEAIDISDVFDFCKRKDIFLSFKIEIGKEKYKNISELAVDYFKSLSEDEIREELKGD